MRAPVSGRAPLPVTVPGTVLVAVVVLAVAAGGCLGGRDDGAGSDGTNGTGGPANGASTLARTLYLTAPDGLVGLAPTEAAPSQVPIGSFYRAWAAGDPQPTWTGRPVAGDHLVTRATLTFFYTAEDTVVTTGPQDQGFPEFVVYFGHPDAPMAWASLQGPDVVQAGEAQGIEAELELPTGGLVLPDGVTPIVKIAPVQAQQDAEGGRIVVLVNGTDAPSRIELEADPVDLPAHEATMVFDQTGTLVGSAYVIGQTEDVSSASYFVELAPDSLGLVAVMERTLGAGIADIDLEVAGPDGEVVARSVTPEAREGIALYRPNLDAIGPGEYTVRVTNYGNVVTNYALQVWVLDAPAGGATGG